MRKILVLDASDNVAVALQPITKGDRLSLADGREITAMDEIPFAHKIAVGALLEGAPVLKYGEVIGVTTRPVSAGEHVHVHNIRSLKS